MADVRQYGRHQLVRSASNKLRGAVTEIVKEFDLSYAELTTILAETIVSWSNYAIKDECNSEY